MNFELFSVPLSRRPSSFYNFTRARVGIYNLGKCRDGGTLIFN